MTRPASDHASLRRARTAAAALATALAAALGAALAARPAVAQPGVLGTRGARDTLRLAAVRAQALARDPRARTPGLQARAAALRLRTIAREALPALGVNGQAQLQSQVTRLPIDLPPGLTGGRGLPVPPHDTYDAHLRAELALVDPTRRARTEAARAELAEAQAGVEPARYALRPQVDAAFFGAALAGARAGVLAASLADLDARRAQAERQRRAGAALPGEVAALAAELLARRQELSALDADRAAALVTLGDLTGRAVAADAVLALPDDAALADAVAAARAAADTLRARPEFAAFARRRERLGRQGDVAAAGTRPRLSAYARTGVGRPGLNVLSNRFQGYALGGVQVQWTPLEWGRVDRERAALAAERAIVDADEAAFRESLTRATRADLAAYDRLSAALATDDSVVALRAAVLREAAARYREGVVTAAEYVDRETDLTAARLTRAAHRVERARAGVAVLTTLGLEVR